MRVVVDCHMVGEPRAGDQGNGRYARTLVDALRATAPDPTTVEALVATDEGATILGEPTRRVGSGNVRRLLAEAPRALAGAGAAFFHYVVPPRAPCPLLVVVHDITFRTNPEWYDLRTRALLGTAVPWSIRRAARVVAVSETLARDLAAAFDVPPERISVVRGALDRRLAPSPGAEARVAERWALTRYCLAVADAQPRKNLPALAEAARRVGIELAVAGAPWRGDMSELAGVRMLGTLGDGDLVDLYAAAAVTCQPSLYEAFGLPVLEALACGSPVVGAARGAIPEVAGDAAILVEPTVDGLAQGIRAALEPATAQRLRAAGPRRAEAFSVEAMGRQAWAAVAAATR